MPAALDALIHECLAKDPHDRWQNIADVSRQLRHLRDLMSGQKSGSLPGTPILPVRARPRVTIRRLVWAAAAVAALTAGAVLINRFRADEAVPARLRLHALIAPPEGMYLTDTLALSPDASRLAFVAADVTGRRRLWLRPLSANRADAIADTDNASDPFWSPDGDQIAFFADGKLKRVPAAGGSVTTITEVSNAAGGSWNPSGVILFAQLDAPLMRVASSGGAAEPVTAFDRGLEETHHLYPAFLPDGHHYIYYVNSRERGLYVGALGSSTKTRLFDPDPELPAGAAATPGVYAATGHLLYVRDRVLTARRFDLDTLTASGQPVTVTETVDYDPPGQAAFTTANGVLVFRAKQHRPLAELRWVDRTGKEIGAVPSPPGTFRAVALSPDGRTVALDRRDPQGLPSVWLVDVERGTSSRLTAAYWAGEPLFSPDGRTLAYSVAVDSPPNIVVRGAGSDGTERRVTRHASEQHYATSFTPDGQQLVYQALAPTTGLDLHLVSLAQQGASAQRLLQTRANESLASVSPDGRWLAYVSDESGQKEVYVSRFPELQGKVLVSTGGGSRPFWRRDGKELFYVATGSGGSRVMSASVAAAATEFTAAAPVELFRAVLYGEIYVPGADGQRFLLARPAPNVESVPLEIVVNPLD
jgi:Tol biopolymer transport system component